MNRQQRFEEAVSRYLPNPMRALFIAEAPPAYKVNRLFYFTSLTEGDTLFLEMMKVSYPSEVGYSPALLPIRECPTDRGPPAAQRRGEAICMWQ